MDAQKLKVKRSLRRQRRVRKGIRGTAAKPRLSVYRSNFHIYAQLIDDDAQVTLAAASTGSKGAKVAVCRASIASHAGISARISCAVIPWRIA